MPRIARLGRAVLFVGLFLCTTGFDQASKEWANQSLQPGVRQPVIAGYWDWDLAKNPGAAFSSFIGGAGAQIALSDALYAGFFVNDAFRRGDQIVVVARR